MLRPSPNHGTQRLPNDDDDEAPPPKYIKVTTQSYEAISNFANEIINSDILERLNKTSNADPNTNYNILHDSIERAKEAHLPDKIVKFKKHKHKKNGWITSGILRSIKHRDGMYKKLKGEKPNSHKYITIKTNLKTYNTILKRSIRLAKIDFYHSHFAKYKNDAPKTWSLINSIMNRTKKNAK